MNSHTENKLCDFKNNNFDLLRFLLASTVFLVHSITLSAVPELNTLTNFLSSDIAVKSFFIVSGFLVFMSYEKSKNIKIYFEKRIRRIYPAYFFVIIFFALLGSFFSIYNFGMYFSYDFLYYILSNLAFLNFLHPDLPGLFTSNHFSAVNGALWTLKIEVLFYCLVPFIVMGFKKMNRPFLLGLIFICSIFYNFIMQKLGQISTSNIYLDLQHQLPGQLCYFIVGAAAYYYFDLIKKYKYALLAISFFTLAIQPHSIGIFIAPISLGFLVIYFSIITTYLGNFGKYGDFSYGIYITHFPILQILIHEGLFTKFPYLALLISAILVFFASYILWHVIEKRFLYEKSHYTLEEKNGS